MKDLERPAGGLRPGAPPVEWGSFREARLQVHWAAQIPAALASALVPERSDDSHSNFGWHVKGRYLQSRRLSVLGGIGAGSRVALHPATLSLLIVRADDAVLYRRSLEGLTLAEGLAMLRSELEGLPGVGDVPETPWRTYDLPDHPVGTGDARFSLEAGAATFRAVSDWFGDAHRLFGDYCARWLADDRVDGMDRPRVWPHHFDLGGLVHLADGQRFDTLGFGFEPADEEVTVPYLYLNPYPQPEAALTGPAPGVGAWQDGPPKGAILRADRLVGETEEQRVHDPFVASREFLDAATGALLEE